jgi:hypothetical protein
VAGRIGPAASKAAQARRIEVIRALWPTDCTLDAIGERLGIAGKTVALLAKRAGLPSRHALNQTVPKPGLVSPEPRPGPRKPVPTPEQIAKAVTAKLESPAGQPTKAEVTLRLVLPRAVLERLVARAHREGYPSLAALVQAVLEREGTG